MTELFCFEVRALLSIMENDQKTLQESLEKMTKEEIRHLRNVAGSLILYTNRFLETGSALFHLEIQNKEEKKMRSTYGRD